MSAPISVLLDLASVRVMTRDGRLDRVIAWSPDAPAPMADALRSLVGNPSSIVVVVGLGFLEIAQPDLPPLSADARRALLWRDVDRYFPLDEPVAVACVDSFAFAVPAARLRAWVQALGVLGPVRSIITAPQLAAALVASGTCELPAGAHERGVVSSANGTLHSVRRTPLALDDAPTSSRSPRADTPSVDPVAMGGEAIRWMHASLDVQLLDASLARAFRTERQQRWVVSITIAVAAVLLLLWSSDRWRGAQLRAVEFEAAQLAERAEPARHAEARRSRAATETTLLDQANAARDAADAPLAVLAQLSRVLPKDVFVQRLEWDGTLWRVDGTADNARRLVPLLDGDAHFRDVRIATASQRFLDAGRQRESFSISFRMKDVQGGARGTP